MVELHSNLYLPAHIHHWWSSVPHASGTTSCTSCGTSNSASWEPLLPGTAPSCPPCSRRWRTTSLCSAAGRSLSYRFQAEVPEWKKYARSVSLPKSSQSSYLGVVKWSVAGVTRQVWPEPFWVWRVGKVMACRLKHGVLELVLLGEGHHPKWSNPQQRRDVRLSLLTASNTRPHLLKNMLIQFAGICHQCSPASLPKGPGSPVATLSCDSAASAPCGTRGATPPLPTISTWRVNRATPAAAAVVVVLAAAAVVAAAASHAAGAEVEVQWNLWEPTHCLLPPHSSAEAQNSLQRPHPAEPADGSIFNQSTVLEISNLMWIRSRLLTLSPLLSHSCRRCHQVLHQLGEAWSNSGPQRMARRLVEARRGGHL